MSALLSFLGETLNGLSSIRAYNKVQDFILDNQNKIERNNQATYMSFTANRWLGIRLEFFGSMVVFAAAFFAVVSRNQIDPGTFQKKLIFSFFFTIFK
jgi:ATP-binding cassette subfamily C (CFTR/MRP) protein 1